MSTPRRVIGHACLPVRLPIWQGIVLWLFLDRLAAPPLWFGIIGTLYGLWLIVAFTEWLATEEHKVRGFGNTPTGLPDD
jgi:hypothetical protein